MWGMGFSELSALTSPSSLAKSQGVKAQPYATAVSIRQYVIDEDREGVLDRGGTAIIMKHSVVDTRLNH